MRSIAEATKQDAIAWNDSSEQWLWCEDWLWPDGDLPPMDARQAPIDKLEKRLENILRMKYDRVPAVGDGVSICYVSDRYPGTIAAISASGATIKVRNDKWKVVQGSMHDGSAEYEFEEDEEGEVRAFRLVKEGRYRGADGGPWIALGRTKYYDPHF